MSGLRTLSSRTATLTMMRTKSLSVACLAAVLSLAGCSSDPTQGYAFTSSYDSTIRTVSVPIFQNPTFAYGLEVELTDAIIKEIQRTTPWRVVAEGNANSTLTGTLTRQDLRQLSTQRDTGLAQELAVQLTVDFDFRDARTGKVLVSRRNFAASDTFVPTRGVGERIEIGQHAAIERLARDIVSELRASW